MRAALLIGTIALVALVAPVFAHVRILQTGFPIRNAASPKLDGAFSVAGPCGGVGTYGVQGITTVTSGQVLSVKIAYNGGHQDANNAFHAAYYCGTTTTLNKGDTFDDSVLKLKTQPATLSSPGLLPLTDGTALVPAADSSTAGYTLTFKAPLIAAGATSQPCVISLLDQRQWGGCIDINLVPAGSGATPGDSDTLTNTKSPCTRYCDMMQVNCVGQYSDFPSTSACMSACGNYTQVVETPGEGTYSGENLQCRQHHVEYVAMYPEFNYTHCPHAAQVPARDGGCYQSIADGERAVAPCWQYCQTVTANCASSKFYTDMSDCLGKCAGFLSTGLGSDVGAGNNTQCRMKAALAGGASCADANPVATGECSVANPLKINDDTISAIYGTVAGQCDTASARAANTISGCCCVAGTITVIHVKGSVLAQVTSNLTMVGGQMCNSGFQSIPNGADPTKPNANYTFSAAVDVEPLNFVLRQTSPGSTDLAGSFNIGGDPFTFQLVDNLLVVTNNVPSTQAPRVCSIQAKPVSKIDSSGMTPPVDPVCVANPTDPSCIDDSGVGNSSALAQVSLFSIVSAFFALFAAMRI